MIVEEPFDEPLALKGNERFREEVTAALAKRGIIHPSAWRDWLEFSFIQSANCLDVRIAGPDPDVDRFKAWLVSRDPEDAWS